MKRILVVEDDKDIIELVRYNLEKDGYQVGATGDGATGLAQLRTTPPDETFWYFSGRSSNEAGFLLQLFARAHAHAHHAARSERERDCHGERPDEETATVHARP